MLLGINGEPKKVQDVFDEGREGVCVAQFLFGVGNCEGKF